MHLRAPAAYAASAALHVLALAGLVGIPSLPPMETVAVEIVDVDAPPPPPADAPAPPAPTPEPLAPPRRAQPRRVTVAPRDAPPPEPRRAPDPAPPPPNDAPPDDAPPKRAPVRVGVSMSGSTASGTFSAPAGNTLYGEMPNKAPEPEEVTAYASERYVPPTQVTVLPRAIRCEIPRAEYPEAARSAGVEGRVVLKLLVDETGHVAQATIVEEPGHGLGAAAVDGVKRYCRFDAARRGDTKVATWLRYTIRWELE